MFGNSETHPRRQRAQVLLDNPHGSGRSRPITKGADNRSEPRAGYGWSRTRLAAVVREVDAERLSSQGDLRGREPATMRRSRMALIDKADNLVFDMRHRTRSGRGTRGRLWREPICAMRSIRGARAAGCSAALPRMPKCGRRGGLLTAGRRRRRGGLTAAGNTRVTIPYLSTAYDQTTGRSPQLPISWARAGRPASRSNATASHCTTIEGPARPLGSTD